MLVIVGLFCMLFVRSRIAWCILTTGCPEVSPYGFVRSRVASETSVGFAVGKMVGGADKTRRQDTRSVSADVLDRP